MLLLTPTFEVAMASRSFPRQTLRANPWVYPGLGTCEEAKGGLSKNLPRTRTQRQENSFVSHTLGIPSGAHTYSHIISRCPLVPHLLGQGLEGVKVETPLGPEHGSL